MGCNSSKAVQERAAEIDLFAPQPAEQTTKSDGSTNTTDSKGVDLNDEYSFAKLVEEVFQVGTDCVVDDDTGTVCGRVGSVHELETCLGQKYIAINLMTIKSSGSVFFRSAHQAFVLEFPGKKNLSELAVRPVLSEEKVKLRERGLIFAKHGLGAHHMLYNAKMYVRGCLGTSQVSAEGRVMVDTSSFLHFNPNYGPLHGASRYGQEEDIHGFLRRSTSGAGSKTTSQEIPDSSLHLCWPTLCGFSLKTKRWGEIAVSALSDIQFNDQAFSQLVFDQESKTMVRSLVDNVHKETQFTDIIQGKGGGCIFLLHGPPGVGKTLTAEAVSETLHRPLYCIDVGELGVTPTALEEALKKILEVAERWNAVVLIDECDIFLTARDKSDIMRNAMVGIFLRLLEYYHGVLFLTSNRADDMDEAFESRISVSLEYKNLDLQSRKQVWGNLLTAASNDGDFDLDKLATHELNGRQIKTAIRLAMSLARAAEETLAQKHLEQTTGWLRQ